MNYKIVYILLTVLVLDALGKRNRIIGGRHSTARQSPYMAAFKYIENNLIFCGGAIISNKHILTAAHCLYFAGPTYDHIRIYTGITLASSNSGQMHSIAHAFIHPWFTWEISEAGANRHDIAIVMLAAEIELNYFQNAIQIAFRNINDYDSGKLVGWGTKSHPNDEFPLQLQKADMTVYPLSVCLDMFDFNIHYGQFCAFNQEGVGPCFGDGGSPLVINGKLAGIMSYMIPCAQGLPDLYTNVYAYAEYILEMIRLTS